MEDSILNTTISGKTRLLCLLGSPVAHSKSPLMHNEACQLLGLDYAYLAFDVKEAALSAAVAGLKTMNARGWNLTMPLKTAMVSLVDELTPAAKLAQSVNTVINDNGHLVGHTTDGIGFMRSVSDAGVSIIGKEIVLLGAGGAATAICVQAALDGVSAIRIFRRKSAAWNDTVAFASRISSQTSCEITVEDIADSRLLSKRLSNAVLLVNATNVGMSPNIDATPLDQSLLYPELAVTDIIYNPKQTRLLMEASEIGCKTFNGLYMLLYQGAESFQCWTGEEMPVEQIRIKFFNSL